MLKPQLGWLQMTNLHFRAFVFVLTLISCLIALSWGANSVAALIVIAFITAFSSANRLYKAARGLSKLVER